jgi:hypothetical protein
MKAMLIIAALMPLAGCAVDSFEPVQTGDGRYLIGGDSEAVNASKAQAFCRAKGYAYAQTTYTDTGLTRFDADRTTFFCMNNGDYLTSRPDVQVDVYNHN